MAVTLLKSTQVLFVRVCNLMRWVYQQSNNCAVQDRVHPNSIGWWAVIHYGMIYLYIPRSFYSQGRKQAWGSDRASGWTAGGIGFIFTLRLTQLLQEAGLQTGCENQPDSYAADTDSPSPALKRTARENGHLLPRRVSLKNLCSYTSSTPLPHSPSWCCAWLRI